MTPKARRIVTPHRIDMMNFRAGDGSSDPGRNEIDRGDGCFFGGSTVPFWLARSVLASLVEAGGMPAFAKPSFLCFLPLLTSCCPSIATATAIAMGRLSRWMVDLSMQWIFVCSVVLAMTFE